MDVAPKLTVLIPLNSGLVFTYLAATFTNPGLYLNPFEFRAGIYLAGKQSLYHRHSVLIPLNSGLVFTSHCMTIHKLLECLNPFEFRAGIYLDDKRNASWYVES